MNHRYILGKGRPMADERKMEKDLSMNKVRKTSDKMVNRSMVIAVLFIIVLLINTVALAWFIVANEKDYSTSQATILCTVNMTSGHNISDYYLHFHSDIFPGGVEQYSGVLNVSQNATFMLVCTWIGSAAHPIEIEAWSSSSGTHSYSVNVEIHPDDVNVYYFNL